MEARRLGGLAPDGDISARHVQGLANALGASSIRWGELVPPGEVDAALCPTELEELPDESGEAPDSRVWAICLPGHYAALVSQSRVDDISPPSDGGNPNRRLRTPEADE